MSPLALPPAIDVLGTPLTPTTYGELLARIQEHAGQDQGHPVGLSFANTHIVSLRRADKSFRQVTASVDHFLPDGMPLVWCLNRAGAQLRDRVYGPAFMRHAMENARPGQTHYLLGGSPECGALLRERAAVEWPHFRIVGSYHGRCSDAGILGASVAEDEAVWEELERLRPDCVWIGMGPTKQYVWMARAKQRLGRGVFLSVGCAFDMHAGLQKDAPPWMQRAGLTWLYRIFHEPRRLAGRYVRYNTLFLLQILRQWIAPAHTAEAAED